MEAAVSAVHSAHYVGVLELLTEALCVFEYRVRGSASAGRSTPAERSSFAYSRACRTPILSAVGRLAKASIVVLWT